MHTAAPMQWMSVSVRVCVGGGSEEGVMRVAGGREGWKSSQRMLHHKPPQNLAGKSKSFFFFFSLMVCKSVGGSASQVSRPLWISGYPGTCSPGKWQECKRTGGNMQCLWGLDLELSQDTSTHISSARTTLQGQGQHPWSGEHSTPLRGGGTRSQSKGTGF